MFDRGSTVRRRTVLRTAAVGAVGAALAGCGGDGDGGTGGDGNGGGDGGDGAPPSYDGFLDDTDNYDGVADETGSDGVTVDVGTEGNGGAYSFDPVAVRVDAGTTVTWEWTGEGQQHDVVAEDGSFESGLSAEAGHTFSHTFEESGTWRYACTPHRSVGMRGVVEVE